MTTRRRASAARDSLHTTSALNSRWLASQLKALAWPLRGRCLCIAFSGGIDSTALLALAAPLRRSHRCSVRALHVHHGLHPLATQWAQAARAWCAELKVELSIVRVRVPRERGASIEAAARQARYAAFAAELAPDELLLLAQHQDDQLETVLLQLLRGAGAAGLAAMAPIARCGAGILVRPLLGARRAQLEALVRAQGLRWSEDPSNLAEKFDRNYLRHRVLPALLERWPAAPATVSRSATLMAEAQRSVDAVADSLLSQAIDGDALSVPILRRFGASERAQVVRRYLRLRALPLPDQRRLLEITGPVLEARHDGHTVLHYGEVDVHRFGSRLIARLKLPSLTSDMLSWRWRQDPSLVMAGAGALSLERQTHGPIRLAALPEELTVRFRQGGERIPAPQGHHTLKHLLQERGVPPWLRTRVPLIYAGERLLAVAGYWADPGLRTGGGVAARLVWQAP